MGFRAEVFGVAVVMVVAMGFEVEVSRVAMRFLGFIWKRAENEREERDEREKI